MLTGETFLVVLEQRGLSVSELARRMGCSRPHLSEALRGKRAASLDYWIDVARQLGVTRDQVQVLLEPRPVRMVGHGLNAQYRART
jgi:transcriptional regulator with XRE-family HTH domain